MKEQKLEYKFYFSNKLYELNQKLDKLPHSFVKYSDIYAKKINDLKEKSNLYFYAVEKKKKTIKIIFQYEIIYNYSLNNDYKLGECLKDNLIYLYDTLSINDKKIVSYFLNKNYEIEKDKINLMNKNDDLSVGKIIDSVYNCLSNNEKEKLLKYLSFKVSHAKINIKKKKQLLTYIEELKESNYKKKIKR